jgi:hypothetical protein
MPGGVLSLVAPMRWFASPALLLPLFAAPALLAIVAVHRRALEGEKTFEDATPKAQRAMFLTGLMSAEVLLLVLTVLGSGAGFLPLFWTLPPALGLHLSAAMPAHWSSWCRQVALIGGCVTPDIEYDALYA